MLKESLIGLLALCQSHFGEINPAAPTETKQFEPLLGSWQITDYQLQNNGDWKEGPGADWHWYSILDGFAIQDDWIAPPKALDIPESERQYGTNIRIFNPARQQWEMAWMSKKGQQLNTFTAVEKKGNLVMEGQFSGNNSRITFFNITETTFQWKMEFLQGETWQEVYRISAIKQIQ